MNKPAYLQKNHRGRKGEMSQQAGWYIKIMALNSTMSLKWIKTKLRVTVRELTIHKLLKPTEWLDNRWISQKIHLSKIKKQCHLLWAEQYVTWKREWKWVFHSHRRKFNLNSLDVCSGYWDDLRQERHCLEKRNNDQKSVISYLLSPLHKRSVPDG